MSNAFIKDLEKYTESEWLAAVESLLPEIHEVDRNAVQIWFRFYPLDLVNYVETSEDPEEAMKGLAMDGDFGVLDKIDTSHRFLYGHRFWPQVKDVITKRADTFDGISNLVTEIKAVARFAAIKAKTTEPLVTAMAAIGLMTLNQVGLDEFKKAPGAVQQPTGIMTKSPEQIVAERGQDDSQGLFGFLKTVDKEFSVAFEALPFEGTFKVINEEEIASASQKDRSRDWQSLDYRCWEGPVPIECTSASCGTCWVGVLGGQEKLSDPSLRERRAMKVFGYNQPEDEKPFIRLACQARATGNITIVIPPWNAVFGKKVRGNVEEVELEPATTSAAKLRETIASAASGE
ncbi:MAG TPA: 2Fe-2S iron-sulfur cluster-binding protein [Pyrinomonadaceae bacterium]|jgi:ferredoxin|nr:2Fe-2S iron-sulfur cluster-binding protein [Pyrinomonadaceae bacterium]